MRTTAWLIALIFAVPAAAQDRDTARMQRLEDRVNDLSGQLGALESMNRSGAAQAAPAYGGAAPGGSSYGAAPGGGGGDDRIGPLSGQIRELAQRLAKIEARLGLAPAVGEPAPAPGSPGRSGDAGFGAPAAAPPRAGESYGTAERASPATPATTGDAYSPPADRSVYSGSFDRQRATGSDEAPFRPASPGGFSTRDEPQSAGARAVAPADDRRTAAPDGERRAALAEPTARGSDPAARNAYDAAAADLSARRYRLASQGFEGFLSQYPSDPLAPLAQFQLGETAYASGDWRRAADAYLKSTRQFPNSEKAAESYLRLGMSLKRLGEDSAACDTFSELGKRFPSAPASVTSRAETEKRRAAC